MINGFNSINEPIDIHVICTIENLTKMTSKTMKLITTFLSQS